MATLPINFSFLFTEREMEIIGLSLPVYCDSVTGMKCMVVQRPSMNGKFSRSPVRLYSIVDDKPNTDEISFQDLLVCSRIVNSILQHSFYDMAVWMLSSDDSPMYDLETTHFHLYGTFTTQAMVSIWNKNIKPCKKLAVFFSPWDHLSYEELKKKVDDSNLFVSQVKSGVFLCDAFVNYHSKCINKDWCFNTFVSLLVEDHWFCPTKDGFVNDLVCFE